MADNSVLVRVRGLGLIRINQPESVAGIQASVDRQTASREKWAGRAEAAKDIAVGAYESVVPHMQAMKELPPSTWPIYLKFVLDHKFQEVRGFVDMVTEGLTTAQKAAFLTMGFNGLGDLTGLVADTEMYFTDPESRTWFNASLTGAGVAGGALSVSPAMSKMLPIVRKNMDTWRSLRNKIPDIDVAPNIVQPPSPALVRATGRFSGAPRGLDSDKALDALRVRLVESAERGAPGRLWYDQSFQSADALTGGRPGYRDLYTGNIAVTSAGVSVPANQLFGIKGYNQAITGSPISTGQYPANTRATLESLRSGEATLFGPKTGPFYQAVNVGNPGTSVGRPTNDIWMARAFDYRKAPTEEFPDGEIWSEGLGVAQHRFMDDEINRLVGYANENKIAGYDDWTPERVQASIWSDTKARRENKTIEQAAADFSTDLDRFTTNINVESVPDTGLGHLAGIQDNQEYAGLLGDAQRAVMTKDGQDVVSLYSGALTQPTATGFGLHKGVSAESDVLRVLSAPGTGTNVIDPASRKLVEGIAATHGLLRAQESVGFNYLRKAKNVVDRNAVSIDLGRTLNQEEMLRIGNALDLEFAGGIIPTNTKSGINILVIDAGKAGDDWQKRLSKIVKSQYDVKPQWMHNSGDLVGSFEGYMPSEYMKSIDRSGVVDQLELSARAIAPALEKVDAVLVSKFPDIGTRSRIVQATREALIEGGFPLVRELIAQGVLPAIVGAVALSALSTNLLPGHQQSGERPAL
ncbi:MAG TPA: hypothetical protein DCS89_05215 [Gammaproteobacteria bacterium]|nr:hypothetical protein [Gammaproteobacteria bacterium]